MSPENKLMSVPVKLSPTFEAGIPKQQFDRTMDWLSRPSYMYDISSDGQRVLINSAMDSHGLQPLQVVINWQTLLRK